MRYAVHTCCECAITQHYVCAKVSPTATFFPWWTVIPYLTYPYGLAEIAETLRMVDNTPMWIQVVRAGVILTARVEDFVSRKSIH